MRMTIMNEVEMDEFKRKSYVSSVVRTTEWMNCEPGMFVTFIIRWKQFTTINHTINQTKHILYICYYQSHLL